MGSLPLDHKTASWQARADDKQSRILTPIPQAYNHPSLTFSTTSTDSVLSVPARFLTPEEQAITLLKAEELVPAISSGKYTAVAVLEAFTHRAAIAHRLLNCCLEFLYPGARAKAERLDAYLAATGKTVGPLHGLPVSVKDQCRVVGSETTCGFVANLGTKDGEDSVIVSALQDAGAVVFVKTNLSVGCMWGETVNNIIGRTSNAFNRSFSCGGSSGGEGALLAFRGSPMGVGSDLGGSIRSPSSYNGIWGLRPSSGRIPYHRMLNSMEGQETIPSVVGPMSLSAESLKLFTKTVLDSQPWLTDPKCVPIPWREVEYAQYLDGRKLRVGIMDWDGVMLPQPPVRRAIREVEAKLKSTGHDTIPWRIDQKKSLDLITRIFSSDSNADIDHTISLSGEPALEQLSQSPTSKPPLILTESWALAMERLDFQAAVLKQWNETATANSGPIDIYIAPVNPSVCPKHGDFARVRYVAYTGTANLLDFTACTIPVTFVDERLDLKDDASGERDAEGMPIPGPTGELDRKVRAKYDPGVYKGLPVGVQVVGRRLEEEKVLAVAELLGRLMCGP